MLVHCGGMGFIFQQVYRCGDMYISIQTQIEYHQQPFVGSILMQNNIDLVGLRFMMSLLPINMP